MNAFNRFTAATMFACATALAMPALAARTDLTLGMALEPPHLDATGGAPAAIREVTYDNIYQGLTRLDSDGNIHPALAKSWEMSDDGLVYTFTLNSGVKFHDGTDFDAEDVKFTLDRARSADSTNPQKQLFAHIAEVEVVDPTTVKITLDQPVGNFLHDMARGEAVIVAPESAENNKTNPVGTGPFKFENWAKGSEITLVKNPDYWGTPAKLDKVTFRIIPDPATAVPALLSGDVQGFANMPVGDALSQIQGDPRFEVVIGATQGETILSTNNGKAPFDNLKVRQAIAHALNRDAIIAGAADGGAAIPIGSHFSPTDPAYIDLTGTYPYDIAKAKELLAEAGYPNGFSATLKLPPPRYARDGGQIIAAQLKEIGIELEIIPLEWADWVNSVFKGKDYDLSIVSHAEPNDIGVYARDDYYFDYHNPKFNEIIAEVDKTADQAKRTELLQQAQKILADDAVNGWLFELPKIGVWDAKLKGMWTNWPIFANDLTEVYWED